MKIPRVPVPPTRSKSYNVLTPMQRIEAWSWFKAKQFLGSYKSKAAELGITTTGLQSFINRALERERKQAKRMATSNKKFEKQLESLPY